MGRRLVYDCETDGFLPELTRIHCLAARDLDTDEVFSFVDHRQSTAYPDISAGLELLAAADEITAHNGIEFDHQAILKCFPSFTYTGRYVDTMVLSRFIFSNIKENDFKLFRRGKFPAHLLMKPHSIEAWGYRLGVRKAKYEGGWEKWSQEMHDYMLQDVVVLQAVYKHLFAQNPAPMSVETELEVAWYLHDQKTNGFKLDVPAAVKLYTEVLLPRRISLEASLKERFKSWYVADGKEKVQKRTTRYKREHHLPEDVKETFFEGSTFQPIKKILFNPGSRQHIARVLQKEYGWKPQEFTDSGEVEVTDDIVSALPYPEAPLLTEYLLVNKRIGALAEGKQAWLKLVTKDGFIHGSVNQSGAVTHRATHSNPNMTQVPKVGSPYGKECRSLFCAPPGWKLIGADASGLELRCLSHFMAKYDGGAYRELILNGDVHTANWNAGKPWLTTRDMAKTFMYAFIYGAGDWKIGHTCRPLADEEEKVRIGRALKAHFLKSVPALGQLVAAVEQRTEEKGYFVLPTGHIVHVRKKHAALNSLLQGTGAVICKRWLVHFRAAMKREGLRSGWNGEYAANVWAHDEVQVSVRDDRGLPEKVAEVLTSVFPLITEELKFRCPLAGEAKIGLNWADTH